MPDLNIDLLRDVVDAVEEGAKTGQWNQKDYAGYGECGTTFCTAGYAMLLSGYKVKMQTGISTGFFSKPNGEDVDELDEEAAALLGITYEEADDMFYNMTEDSNQVRIWAKEVAGKRGIDL